MINPPELELEASPPRKADSKPAIFTRLDNRGIQYDWIKRIVQFERPDHTLRFAQWFEGRTIHEVLKHFDKWRVFLEKDFILPLSSEVKSQAEQFIFGTEWMVWQALIEANPKVGPWDLRFRFLPTGQDESGRDMFIHPALQIEAVHRDTKEKREAQILGGKSLDLASLAAAWREAVMKLGLWDQIWKGDPSRVLISKHSRQGWPVFTKFIIPRLYEFMAPHYNSRPHFSEKLDSANIKPKRLAMYPKELLQDMLEILKMEHDWAFEKATVRQLKAVIQRHLAHKSSQIPQP